MWRKLCNMMPGLFHAVPAHCADKADTGSTLRSDVISKGAQATRILLRMFVPDETLRCESRTCRHP